MLFRSAYEVIKNGEKIDISRREYAVLLNLLENTGRVMSREMLEQTMYGWGEEVGSNAVEVYVHHLRKKLGNDLIRTIRGRSEERRAGKECRSRGGPWE
mgnify:CR=1 FL=1